MNPFLLHLKKSGQLEKSSYRCWHLFIHPSAILPSICKTITQACIHHFSNASEKFYSCDRQTDRHILFSHKKQETKKGKEFNK